MSTDIQICSERSLGRVEKSGSWGHICIYAIYVVFKMDLFILWMREELGNAKFLGTLNTEAWVMEKLEKENKEEL